MSTTALIIALTLTAVRLILTLPHRHKRPHRCHRAMKAGVYR